mgnify:CR=1 FL=1
MDILISQVSLAGEDALIGAKRKSYTPACRRDAAHLVIDTGRTIAEIGIREQLLGRWVAIERATMDDPPGALGVAISGPSRSGSAPRTPNCGRTGSF